MGKFGDVLGGSILDGVSKIVGLFKLSPEQAMQHQEKITEISAEMQGKILDAATAQMQAQTEVNKIEAANPSVFVAGWRPFIGWVCGCGLAFQFLFAPLGTWVAALCGHPIVVPTLDTTAMTGLIMGMLGIGGLRTYEKVAGVETKGVGGI